MKFKVLGAAAIGLLAMTGAAAADTMTWKLRSFSKNAIEVSFYSQNRRNEWPGGGKVYVNRTYDVVDYKISCIKGEKVCYGAWLQGNSSRYWGVGKGNQQKCADCCYTCGGNTVTKVHNLNER
ncbi:MAG: hypothetical protein ACK4VM_17815 [Bosea sp. (in: a-proteobacteria)]